MPFRASVPTLFALCLLSLFSTRARASGGDVTTYHNDLPSTGQYLTEPLLSATNVNATNFGKLFSYSTDGQVYGQPLYKSGVSITTGSCQGTRNVVFLVTQNDSVYAFDADDSAGTLPLWQNSFINTGSNVTPVPAADVNSNDINPLIGITSTPVIDPSSNTLFVCAKTKEVISGNNHYVFRLHALNLSNGAERPGSPVVIADTITNDLATYTYVSGPAVAGTGDGSVNGQVTLNALRENQRPALTLVNGVVYIAFASHGDIAPYHGWVLGYSAANYQLIAAWNANPNGEDTGIWQSGGGLSSDANGNLYLMTGNGTFTQPTYDSSSGSYINGSYGDSFVGLAVDTVHTSSTNPNTNGWGLKVVSYFTPYNQDALNGADQDLGSGAPMVLPDSVGSLAHPHLLVGGGKQGTLYMLDRDAMGGYNSTADPVLQEQVAAVTSCFSTPAYFNGTFYVTPGTKHGVGNAFPVSSGSFSATPVSTHDTFGFPGASPCISGTGPADPNAIVWCLDGGNGSNQLRAYQASNFSNEIYTSAQAPNNRDATNGTCKFALPTIANTRVYVPTSSGLIVYGLFNAPATVVPAAPSNLIADGLDENTIWLSWVANSSNQSGYSIEQSTDGSTFTQVGATGSAALSYPVTALTSGSTYCFRVRAYNVIGNSTYSGTAGGTTLTAQPTTDFAAGFGSSGGAMAFNTNGVDSIPPNTPQLQLTTGTNNEAHTAWSVTQVNVSKFTTQFDFQVSALDSAADGFAFAIQRTGTSALGGTGGAYGFGGIGSGVAIDFGLYGGSYAGLYGGASTDVLSAASIDFHSGDMMRVLLNYDGTTLFETITDLATNAVYTTSYTINIPAIIGGNTAYVGFTGATGGFNSIQNILNWTYTFIPSLPAAPTALAGTALGGKVISLAWTVNSNNETGFFIEQSTDDTNFSVIGTVGPGIASENITGLQPGTTYYYRVRAYNAVGNSAYTNIAGVATLGGNPTLDFSGGFAASGSSMAFNTNGTGSIPPNTSQLQLITASNGEAHSAWSLKQVNISAFTTTFDFQVTGQSPLADGFTFAIQRSGTSALGGTGGAYGFGGIGNGVAIDFGLYGGSYTGLYGGTVYNVGTASNINYGSGNVMRVVLTYDGTTLSQTITDLTTKAVFAQSYTINIPSTIGGSTAYVGFTGATGGFNSVQDILDWTFTALPLAPTNLAVTPISDTQAQLTWTNNAADNFGYEIDRASDAAFTLNAQALAAPAAFTGTGTYADTGLSADTIYYYRIRAMNSAGDSAYSGTAGVLTYCTAPAGPEAIGGNGNVSMAWSASTGATTYNLYRSVTSGSEGSIPYQPGIALTSFVDNSATNGTTYYYTVSAVNPSGAGPQSAEFTALPSASVTLGQWKLQQFGSVAAAYSAAAADTATPVGDGIANLMKYALGLNPYVPGSAGLPAAAIETIGGLNYLTLTFIRPHPAPGDITYHVETTTYLRGGMYTPAAVITGYPVDNGNGTETMKERSSLPSVSSSQFIRLRVTNP